MVKLKIIIITTTTILFIIVNIINITINKFEKQILLLLKKNSNKITPGLDTATPHKLESGRDIRSN